MTCATATTDKLVDLLKRLHSGDDPQSVKREAQKFLATIDPSELDAAEQKLIDG